MIPARLLTQTVTVTTYLGTTGIGRSFAAYVDEESDVVVSPESREQVSTGTVIYVGPGDGPAFTDESAVTLPTGRTAQVTHTSPAYNPRTKALNHYVIHVE